MRRIHTAKVMGLVLGLTAGLSMAQQRRAPVKEGVDSCATAELKKMSDFLAKQGAFTVRSAGTLAWVEEGRKTKLEGHGNIALQRPNKLRLERSGSAGTANVYYDGKRFSVMRPGTDVYATSPAPPKLDAFLDTAEDALGWTPPGADLLYSNPYDVLIAEATGGRCLGISSLDGTKLNHLAFEGPTTNWEIWIEDDETPLPRKMVVSRKDDPKSANYAVELSEWNLRPNLSKSSFEFDPPEGSTRVSFIAPSAKTQKAQQGRSQKGTRR